MSPLCRRTLAQRRVPHSIPLTAVSRQESRAVFPQFLDSFLLGLNKSPHCFPNKQLAESLVGNSDFCLLCIQMAVNFFLLAFINKRSNFLRLTSHFLKCYTTGQSFVLLNVFSSSFFSVISTEIFMFHL